MSKRKPQANINDYVPDHIAAELYPNKGKNGYGVMRNELAQQILRDEREEMIEEIRKECVDAAILTAQELGFSRINYDDMEAITRTILLTAANIWGIERDASFR